MNDVLNEFKAWRKENDLPWNPNFVPRAFDGLADLEHLYWKKEQAALKFEQDRDWKNAMETKALPPSRPRKAPAYVTSKQLEKTLEHMGKSLREFLDPHL